MKETIINIGRQLGSGGKKVGEMLAQELDIPIYDRTLIDLAAQESGFAKEFFEKSDEEKGFLKNLLDLHFPFGGGNYYGCCLSDEALFKTQSDVIRHLAEQKTSCIFVGRCADYILRNDPRCINIFITADEADRIRRIHERHPELTMEQAHAFMQKADHKRAGYYNYYSCHTWGAAETYHLCINSSVYGLQGTMEVIRDFIRRKR